MRISCNTYIDVTVHVTLTCARVFKYDCEDELVRLSPAHAQSTTDQIHFELSLLSYLQVLRTRCTETSTGQE